MKKVTLEDRAVLIINFEGVYYAGDSVYTHFGGDLSEKVDVVTMKTEQTEGYRDRVFVLLILQAS